MQNINFKLENKRAMQDMKGNVKYDGQCEI